MRMMLCICLLVLCLLPSLALAEAVLPAQPPEMPRSELWQVAIDEKPLDVLATAVNHNRTWTSRPTLATGAVALCLADGPVQVTARFPGAALDSIVVRPLALGIRPEITGDTATFTIDRPAQLTLEANGDSTTALHLFILPPEEHVPDEDDPNVLYLAPGVHEMRVIEAHSGQTIYLAPGAVLRGSVHGAEVQDVRICGRGIIDGSAFDRWEDILVPINFERSQRITIEGITILDPAAWTLNTYFCEDVLIDHVQIIGARSNSDGITTQSCQRLVARDCFVRGWDDNLVVKGYDGDVADITFERCLLWTDLAQSCEIGYETRADHIQRITFRDITVLHNFHKPVLSIHNSDRALVEDILFANIIVEDAQLGLGDGQPFLIDLTTTKSQWSKDAQRGSIQDVIIDGVTVLGGRESSIRFFAFNKESSIDHITLRNVNLFGQPITDWAQMKINKNSKLGEDIALEVDGVRLPL